MEFNITYTIGDYPAVNRNIESAVADWIIANYTMFSVKKAKTIYFWNGSHYESDIIDELLNLIESMFRLAGWRYNPAAGNKVVGILSNRNATHGHDLNSNRKYIPFKNGWYNIFSFKLEDPNPDIKITYCLPHEYDPTQECKLFRSKIKEIIPNMEDRNKLLKFMAYCLTSKINLHKSLILYGRGSNGKSVIIDVLKRILGERLYSMIPLQELGSRFNKVVYMDKLCNLADDIPHGGLRDDSFIKEMITGRTLGGEIKNKMPFNYTNTCKLFSTCNQIPAPTTRASDGFYRRWIIIALTQTFTGSSEDVDLPEKLEGETLGIISYILKWLPLINDLKKYTIDDIKEKWFRYGESAQSFFHQCGIEDGYKYMKKTWVYTLYKKWCDVYDLNKIGPVQFGKVLASNGVMSGQKSYRKTDGMGNTVSTKHNVYLSFELYFTYKEQEQMGIEETGSGNFIYKRPTPVVITPDPLVMIGDEE